MTEQWVADKLGMERYPANTGGALDLRDPKGLFGVQVKRRTMPAWFYAAIDTARTGCAGTGLTPIATFVDVRKGKTEGYVVMDIEDFIEWFGVANGGDDEAVA